MFSLAGGLIVRYYVGVRSPDEVAAAQAEFLDDFVERLDRFARRQSLEAIRARAPRLAGGTPCRWPASWSCGGRLAGVFAQGRSSRSAGRLSPSDRSGSLGSRGRPVPVAWRALRTPRRMRVAPSPAKSRASSAGDVPSLWTADTSALVAHVLRW